MRRAFCAVVRTSTGEAACDAGRPSGGSCTSSGAGKRSEAKFGTLLFGHGPLYCFDFILDPHEVITIELIGISNLNALDQGTAPMDKLVT